MRYLVVRTLIIKNNIGSSEVYICCSILNQCFLHTAEQCTHDINQQQSYREPPCLHTVDLVVTS